MGWTAGLGSGRLRQVGLGAADLEASVAFYRDVLGLRLIARFEPPGLAFFEAGEVRLMLDAAAPPGARPGGAVYFAVGDIDQAYASLSQRGAAFASPPALIHRDAAGDFGPPGGEEWMAFCRDPAGNLVAITARR